MTQTTQSSFKHLKEHEDAIYSCSRIGDCREAVMVSVGKYKVCPVREHTPGFEAYHARGRLLVAQGLLEGDIKPSPDLARVAYMCTTCGACKWTCHMTFTPSIRLFCEQLIPDHTKIWEALRADLVEQGLGPMPRHREILEWTHREHNPYMEPHNTRRAWIPKDLKVPEKGETLLFAGCTGPYRRPEILRSLLTLTQAAGVTVAVSSQEWCCGSIALRTGALPLAQELASHNVQLFTQLGVRTIITHCAGCYRTLKKEYPDMVEGYEVEVLHATEFLLNLVEKNRLTFKPLEATVTYHDPCHLGRHSQVYDAPRQLLQAIPKLNLVEMKRIREHSWCCGAGGGVKSAFPELAHDIAADRIQEALETGAQYLVSACPFCKTNLQDAAQASGAKLQVLDLLELAAQAVKQQ